MPKGSSMYSCWADSTLIDKASEYYKESHSNDKIKDSLKNILGNVEGYNGSKNVVFRDEFSTAELENYAKKLIGRTK
jgi:hypothetical protein